MSSKKRKRLDLVVSAIQQRYGPKALRPAKQVLPKADVAHISTSFAALDQALGIGGVPRGCLIEILAEPTSGMTTLALKIISQAQMANEYGCLRRPGRHIRP